MCQEISRDIKRYQDISRDIKRYWVPRNEFLCISGHLTEACLDLCCLGVTLSTLSCRPWHPWRPCLSSLLSSCLADRDKPSHTAGLQHPLSKTWHCGTAFSCRFCWKSIPQIVSGHRFCCLLEQFLQTTSCHGSLQTTSSSQHRWIEHVAQWVRETPEGGSRIRRLLTLQDATGDYTSSKSFTILIHNIIYIYMIYIYMIYIYCCLYI